VGFSSVGLLLGPSVGEIDGATVGAAEDLPVGGTDGSQERTTVGF
jgi:hypothetical protein